MYDFNRQLSVFNFVLYEKMGFTRRVSYVTGKFNTVVFSRVTILFRKL